MDNEKEVKRYAFVLTHSNKLGRDVPNLEERKNGECVLYSDWQAEKTKRLEAEKRQKEVEERSFERVKALESKLKEAKVYIYQGSDYEAELLNKQHQQIKELEAKVKELEVHLFACQGMLLSDQTKLATANAKIVELEKEIQAKNNEDSTQPNTIKENLSYFVSRILNAHAARALGREPMDFPSMGNEEATLKIIKKFESELSTVNKKAEKLVEALEPIRKGGYSGASYIVQQALNEFRGGE